MLHPAKSGFSIKSLNIFGTAGSLCQNMVHFMWNLQIFKFEDVLHKMESY